MQRLDFQIEIIFILLFAATASSLQPCSKEQSVVKGMTTALIRKRYSSICLSGKWAPRLSPAMILKYAASKQSSLPHCESPLVEAIKARRSKITEWLIEYGADVKSRDFTGRSVQMIAYGACYFEILDLLLRNNSSTIPRLQDPTIALTSRWKSPLLDASCRGNAGTASVLSKHGLKNGSKIEVGYEELNCAFQRRHVPTMIALLQSGRIRSDNMKVLERLVSWTLQKFRTFMKVLRMLLQSGVSAAMETAEPVLTIAGFVNATPEVYELLLRYVPNINIRGTNDLRALHWACIKNNFDSVKFLVQHGANVDALSTDLTAPLHFATAYASYNIIEFLLKIGAFVDSKDSDGETPLSIAVQFNRPVEVIKLLLDYGADIDATTSTRGDSPLAIAVTMQGSIKSAKLLLNRGASVEIRNKDGLTPLLAAVKSNASLDIILLLLNHTRVNVNDSATDGFTALMFASENNNIEAVHSLLDKGADPDATTEKGETAIYRAISNKASAAIVAESLIRRGANVNRAITDGGDTALMLASRTNQTENVEVLLKSGANVNTKNSQNYTALTFAVDYNASTSILEMLLQNGADRNVRDAEGCGLTTHATSPRIISFLLNHGFQLEAMNTYVICGNYYAIRSQNSGITLQEQTGIYGSRDFPFQIVRTDKAASKTFNVALLTQLVAIGATEDCTIQTLGRKMLELINKREDIMPGFAMELHYYKVIDWSFHPFGNMHIPVAIEQFANPYLTNNDTLRLPFIAGPKYGCMDMAAEVTEGIALAIRIVQNHFHMTSVHLEKCHLGEPNLKSNFVNDINEHHFGLVTLMSFLKSKRFGFIWKQVALIGGYSQEITSGIFDQTSLYSKWLTSNGIEVLDYQFAAGDFTATFDAIKQSRARIIIVTSKNNDVSSKGVERCAFCEKILCSSYSAGVRPNRYVVMMPMVVCLELKCIAKNSVTEDMGGLCKKEIRLQQTRMLFIGVPQKVVTTSSSVSYVVAKFFEDVWDSTEAAKTVLDDARKKEKCPPAGGDWENFQKILKTTIYLWHTVVIRFQNNDELATLLKQGMDGNKTAALKIEKLISDAAVNAKVVSSNEDVLTGLVIQPNFDYSQSSKAQWREYVEWRVIAKIRPVKEDGLTLNLNFSSHNVTPDQSILWFTSNGKAPKDLSIVLELSANYNEIASLLVLSVTAVVVTAQLFVAVYILTRKRRRREIYFDRQNNLFVLAGCLILDVSVITILTGTELFPSAMCYFRAVFPVIGLTACNGMLFVRMVAMPTFTHENRYISRQFQKRFRFDLKYFEKQRKANMVQLEKKTTLLAGAILAVVTVTIAIWLAVDPVILKTTVANVETPVYVAELDSLVTYRLEWCESRSQLYAIYVFGALQCVFLLFGIFIGLAMKQKVRFTRNRWKAEVVNLRMALTNALTIIVFVAVLMFIVPSKPATIWYLKVLLYASGEVLYSASTTGILFSTLLSPMAMLATKKSNTAV